jgi:hypothetical protein
VAFQCYELLVETYQQHVDLILKCVAVYLAIVGAVTGLVFSADVDPQRRTALLGVRYIIWATLILAALVLVGSVLTAIHTAL